jgi:hypothetical protein
MLLGVQLQKQVFLNMTMVARSHQIHSVPHCLVSDDGSTWFND